MTTPRSSRARSRWLALVVGVASLVAAAPAHASGLEGSRASMTRQHGVAVDLDYRFVRTPSQVEQLVDAGKLERLAPSGDLALADVSYPYARPEVGDFVRRLARQYRDSTGGKLVVTSLTRPTSLRPRNASPLSVHPAGMAVDLRVPTSAEARRWLERTLLGMEEAGVLDVTREHRPPHFHIAVFPKAFRAYAARQDSLERAAADAAALRQLVAVDRARTVRADVAAAAPVGGGPRDALLLLGSVVLLGGAGAVRVARSRSAR